MNNVNDNQNIFIPSFKFERKTKGFNRALWCFVGLISMFSTFLFAIVPYLFLSSLFDIVSAFILDNLAIVMVISTIIFALIFGIGIYKFLSILLHSYKFEDNKIIKGRIINPEKVKGSDLVFDTIITTYMAENITNSKAVLAGTATKNMNVIINLIKLNMKQEFVNQYFDSPLYKKKTYTNPTLLKETKYHLVYICDNNKKLKIPKIYNGMDVKLIYSKQNSLISRILIRSLIVFLIFFLISICDLGIGYNSNNKHINSINNTYKSIEYNLTSYGYTSKKINEKCYVFEKHNGNRNSTIRYSVDKNGNIINGEIDIYFSPTSNAEELSFIIKSLNDDFTNEEIENFVSNVNSCINGTCSYNKLVSNKNVIRIGTSNGFIQVHN